MSSDPGYCGSCGADNFEHRLYCEIMAMPRKVFRHPPGIKADAGKILLDLLPWREVYEVAAVFNWVVDNGKYVRNNWQEVQNAVPRYCSAGIRHFAAILQGENLDTETKLKHAAHAACCALIVAWFQNKESK